MQSVDFAADTASATALSKAVASERAGQIANQHELAMAQIGLQQANLYENGRTLQDVLMPLSIIALVCGAIVSVVFGVMKFLYRKRERRFELEKLWVERGGELPFLGEPREAGATKFVRTLLVLSVIFWAFMAFLTVINARSVRGFFDGAVYLLILAALSWGVIALFRLYLRRSSGTDE